MPVPGRQRGVTFLWILGAVAVLGVYGGKLGEIWSTTAQREREAELLFVGAQIRDAIGAYYENTPGTAKQYPRSLEQLLKDERYPQVRRYLRRLYPDPFSGTADWGLVTRPDGSVVGVYSKSTVVPFRRVGLEGVTQTSAAAAVRATTATGQPPLIAGEHATAKEESARAFSGRISDRAVDGPTVPSRRDPSDARVPPGAESIADWKFIYQPVQPTAPAATKPSAPLPSQPSSRGR